jgi:hypothetical protein
MTGEVDDKFSNRSKANLSGYRIIEVCGRAAPHVLG